MADGAALVECSSDPAFAIDENACVVGWNGAIEALLGHAASEAMGRHCHEILEAVLPGGEPLCTPLCEGAACFKQGRPFAVAACRLRRKDGGWVSASISSLVMPREDGVRPAGRAVAIVFLRENPAVAARGAAAEPLRIYTLGHFGLAVGGRGLAVETWKRKQAITLLKYLITSPGRPIHRERLIECLWPDADAAHGWERLRVTVYYLRKQLREAGLPDDVVETVGQSYMLRPDAVWIDAEVFEKQVAEAMALERQQRPDEALGRYEDARALYRGDFMEEEIYADWCAEERQRLHERYLDVLAGLADCYTACGRLAEGAQVCRVALCSDPCRESFLRTLLENFVHLGRADWAEAEFRHWQRVLADDFGLELMDETVRLHRELVAGAGAGGDARIRQARAPRGPA